jgi:hypothetical protein
MNELKVLASELKSLGHKREARLIEAFLKNGSKTSLKTLVAEVSDGLLYHIENDLPLCDPIYRHNSTKFFSLVKEARELHQKGVLSLDADSIDMIESGLGKFAEYDGFIVPIDSPMSYNSEPEILRWAAEYQGKKVNIGKPRPLRKGEPGYGRKQNVVYVMDGDKVKRITFGDPNLKAKPEKEKNRKSFRARHKCDQKKDKTKPGYWACRYPPNW